MAGVRPALAWLSSGRGERRRKNDEDQEAREEECRERPRHGNGKPTIVDIHGGKTRLARLVLRCS
jgi:hypothetical protein